MWKKLHQSLKMVPPKGQALPKPTSADLDKAEKKIGAKLPPSYRDFAQLFGPGQHGGYFRIYAPMAGAKYKMSDLAEQTLAMREGLSDMAEKDKDKKFYGRMVPFADTLGGDIFCWDPLPPKGKQVEEYPVFVLVHGSDKIQPMAPDFETFVNKVVYGPDLAKVIKSKEKRKVEMEFLGFGTQTPGL